MNIKEVINVELLFERKRRKKKKKRDACYYKVKSRYDVWPSAYASGALSKCRKVGAENWGNSTKESEEVIDEKWSEKYKKSIDCNNPKGFSQKAHCQGRNKNESVFELEDLITEKRKLTSKPGSETNLRDWFKRKGTKGSKGGWVDCNTCRKDKETGRNKCKPCGRQEGEKRSKYPACRPTPGSCKKYKSSKGKSWGKKTMKEDYIINGKLITEGRELISESVLYHFENRTTLTENIYRYGSEGYFKLINEVRSLYNKGIIDLSPLDEETILTDIGRRGIYENKVVWLDVIYESDEDVEVLNEAEYQGKKVQLGKPKRGGSGGKKFYVYVKCGDRVKKVSFGAKSGGGKLAVKLRDPKARKAFSDRHNCPQKNDKCTAGYWACRLPRYAKALGLSGGGRFW